MIQLDMQDNIEVIICVGCLEYVMGRRELVICDGWF